MFPDSLGSNQSSKRRRKKRTCTKGPFSSFHKDRCVRVKICDKIGWAGISDLLACVRVSVPRPMLLCGTVYGEYKLFVAAMVEK